MKFKIRTLNNIAVQINELNALNDLTVQDVRLVNVENVLNNNRAFNNALNRNNVEIITLRNVLNNLTIQDCAVLSCIDVTVTDFLNDNNVAINDVVAISVLAAITLSPRGERVISKHHAGHSSRRLPDPCPGGLSGTRARAHAVELARPHSPHVGRPAAAVQPAFSRRAL
jgi:hypothetical protein